MERSDLHRGHDYVSRVFRSEKCCTGFVHYTARPVQTAYPHCGQQPYTEVSLTSPVLADVQSRLAQTRLFHNIILSLLQVGAPGKDTGSDKFSGPVSKDGMSEIGLARYRRHLLGYSSPRAPARCSSF